MEKLGNIVSYEELPYKDRGFYTMYSGTSCTADTYLQIKHGKILLVQIDNCTKELYGVSQDSKHIYTLEKLDEYNMSYRIQDATTGV